MSYEIELNPQNFARTQQGGCVMTVKDTDTNILEPIILTDGRASGRTAVGRDGLIYDVLPYEPAMSLVNGTMALSLEPLGETLFTYTNFSDVTESSFKYRGDSGLFIGKNNLNFISDGSNREVLEKTIAADAQSTYYYSVFFEESSNNINLNQMITPLSTPSGSTISYSIDGGNTFGNIGNDIPSIDANTRVVAKVVTSTTSGNIVFRLGVGCTSQTIASSISVSSPQIEKDNLTSFIVNETGGTGARLGATGAQTPDMSKWINSESFTFDLDVSALEDGGSDRRITLYGDTLDDRASIMYNATAGVFYAIVKASGVSLIEKVIATGLNQTVKRNISFSFSSGLVTISIDGQEYDRFEGFFNMGQLKFLQLASGAETNIMYGNIFSLKITS